MIRTQKWAALAALLLLGVLPGYAGKPIDRPKLVLGIVVDQMRYDFLYRYWDFYGDDGFKKLLKKGYNFKQAHYPYAPTITGPGHASIYTGSTPAYHGIAGNHWYEPRLGRKVYCTDDSTVSGVGAEGKDGKMSPRNLQATTIGDQLRLSNQFRSKVIGIALKDRGSIFPAGHSANAAYWFEGKGGNFITSNYYMNTLPGWVTAFNSRHLADAYSKQTWSTLVPMDKLIGTVASADTASYERGFDKSIPATLPFDLSKVTGRGPDIIRNSPFGNALTADFALAALQGENLGKNAVTDMLCVSFSSTDVIGHDMGPNSVETADMYIRLDREIARLLAAAEKQAGKGEVLVFLTADHGIVEIPEFQRRNRLPGNNAPSEKAIMDSINKQLQARFGVEKLIVQTADQQLYIDQNAVMTIREGADAVEREAVRQLEKFPFVMKAFRSGELALHAFSNPFAARLYRGHHPKRSGQITFLMRPGYLNGRFAVGTHHSQPYEYDTHVPMVFYGWKVRHGSSSQPVEITDIAPTVCNLLNILSPSGCVGKAVLHLD